MFDQHYDMTDYVRISNHTLPAVTPDNVKNGIACCYAVLLIHCYIMLKILRPVYLILAQDP